MSFEPNEILDIVAYRQRQSGLGAQKEILKALDKQSRLLERQTELLRRQSLPHEEQQRLARLDIERDKARQSAQIAFIKNRKARNDKIALIVLGFLAIFGLLFAVIVLSLN